MPYDEPVRDYMYVHGIELTKHVVVDEQLEVKAAKSRNDLITIITTKRKQGVWFQPTSQPDGSQENWIQAQALASLANTPEFRSRRRTVRKARRSAWSRTYGV